jgi:signal transduction histidine kinase
MKTLHHPSESRVSLPEEPTESEVRVMVLDDDAVDIEAVRRCLSSIEGLETKVTGCADAACALEQVARETFDVLFVDYDLIDMTGLEALEQLSKAGCRVPAVLLTGQHGERLLHEALRAGVMDYVRKDQLHPGLLEQTVYRVLEKAELSLRVERKQIELEYTVERLRKRNEEVESFYHNVSHELRTPLTGAQEFVSLMQEGAAGPLTASQSKLLAATLRSCDQMSHCVDDMLDAARIETGKLILKLKTHDLVAVLQDAVESVRASATRKEIDLRLRGLDRRVEGSFDPHRVFQVAANLISNAIKFTPNGGAVHVALHRRPDESLEVRVGDSGPGIPEGDEQRVFDRLYQSSSEDAALLGGLGMGLYISKQIVELHGGRISCARSSLGGAQITFTLPQLAHARSRREPSRKPV